MNILFYWKKSYFKKEYHITLKDFKLYTNYPLKGISPKDIVWAVTKNEDGYVLVGKLIIKKTKREPSVHGDFCLVGDQSASVYYKLDDFNQKKVKSLIQGLFNWPNDEIGVYFRSEKHIRELTGFDHQAFEKFSKTLKNI